MFKAAEQRFCSASRLAASAAVAVAVIHPVTPFLVDPCCFFESIATVSFVVATHLAAEGCRMVGRLLLSAAGQRIHGRSTREVVVPVSSYCRQGAALRHHADPTLQQY